METMIDFPSLYRFVRGTELVNAQFLKMVHDRVCYYFETIPGGSGGKESAYNAGDLDSIPGSGRSSGEGNGYPLSILAWRIPWTEEPGGLLLMFWKKLHV